MLVRNWRGLRSGISVILSSNPKLGTTCIQKGLEHCMHLKLVKHVIFDYVIGDYVHLVKLGELYEIGDLVNYMKL